MNLPLSNADKIISPRLQEIDRLDQCLLEKFSDKFVVKGFLNRTLVSFQANKVRPVYRWYKYKEAFSASLIEHLLSYYKVQGKILDPFAGSGTALFSASAMGIDADGIELLPIGQEIIATKNLIDSGLSAAELNKLQQWADTQPWRFAVGRVAFAELRITKGAYPEETAGEIEKYLFFAQNEGEKVYAVLRFALLCVLESISFTRKDGQYLRWDHRSGRTQGKKTFDKGVILSFAQAISSKLADILSDLSPTKQSGLFDTEVLQSKIHLYHGSCLDILPTLADKTYDAIVTSPPYCNRYDYTRTYALELALLGADEKSLVKLRQDMLSCTVENREKDLVASVASWRKPVEIANQQALLQAILQYLNEQKAQGVLNNSGIPRMVKGYFYEMACVIAESARLLKPGALLFMVNDNVRYAGASISVDAILSDFAENLGFSVESILILPTGKGNSSQQMGEHGRESLRKCIYVWRKA